MAQYRFGTVTVTNGSPTVTGVNTIWTTNVAALNLFAIFGEGVWYAIETVNSDGSITLASNYIGTNKTGAQYQIQTDFTPENHYPIPSFGDRDTSSLTAYTLLQIDAALAALSPVSAILQGIIQLNGDILIEGQAVIGMVPCAAPADPVSGWSIYVDTADGKLKAKASTGTIVVLGTP